MGGMGGSGGFDMSGGGMGGFGGSGGIDLGMGAPKKKKQNKKAKGSNGGKKGDIHITIRK
jgi:hypothetical protein